MPGRSVSQITLLHETIERAAEHWPEIEAFRCSGEALSYAELNLRCNRLASALLDRGLQRMGRVGIYLHKSLDTAVAAYGTLKAGGAYVPVDPGAPAERVAFILRDCGVRHLITEESLFKRLVSRLEPDQLNCIVGLDPANWPEWPVLSWSAVATDSDAAPAVDMLEQDLAYIMYTSGSTGTPKGLMHTHYSGLSYARYSAQTYGVCPGDRLGNHAPLHFDISTFEFFTGPLCGATSVLVPEEVTYFPRALAELVENERLNYWYSVPLALTQMLLSGHLQERDLGSLRWVMFAGEIIAPKHLATLMNLIPQARFSNIYGPAEVNQCSYYHLPGPPLELEKAIPLGRIWEGAEGLVVDEGLALVADGEPGELLIRSPTQMQGYWGRPDLDKQAFVVRERIPGFSERYYRTGDLVRLDEAGHLQFLGRKDRQVKIRGCRVELDEVEAVLIALPGVLEAAVVVLPDKTGHLQIAAVASLGHGVKQNARRLRTCIAERLPAYALPTTIAFWEDFPRTGSGKIDRVEVRRRLSFQ